MHYQRWWRTGDPLKVRKSMATWRQKLQFTPALWERWLAEHNSSGNDTLRIGIETFRRLCAVQEPRI